MFNQILADIQENQTLSDEAFEEISNASEDTIEAEVGEEGLAEIMNAWNNEVNDRYDNR